MIGTSSAAKKLRIECIVVERLEANLISPSNNVAIAPLSNAIDAPNPKQAACKYNNGKLITLPIAIQCTLTYNNATEPREPNIPAPIAL